MPPNAAPMNSNIRMIIKFAMMITVVLYGVVAFVTVKPSAAFSFDKLMADPFAAIIAFLAVSMILVGKVVSGALKRGIEPKRDESGRKVFDPSQAAKFFSAMVVELALYEAIAVFGLVLTFIKGQPKILAPFALLALVMMASVKTSPKWD